MWPDGGGEDYADFLHDVVRLALRHGPADVFEALLAAGARGSRGAGEHATPGVIARLLTALAPARGTVLDFACGQGTLLLSAAQSAGAGEQVTLVGQDINDAARRLARVRLLVHGHSAELVTGDTLHGQNQYLSVADLVMADPPFAHRWHPDRRTSGVDLPFGVPPWSKPDLAWVQYAIGALRPGGQALVVTSMGALFRGSAEAEIRRNLVQAGCVKAVVGLPQGLYPHTSIPVSVLVLSPPDHGPPPDVVLVDASKMGTRLRGRTELSESDIVKITAAAQRDAGKGDVPAAAVAVDALTAGDCSLAPARWTASETDPRHLVDRVEHAARRLGQASERLAKIGPLPLAVATDGPQTRSTSLLTMTDRGLVLLVRPSRVDAADLGAGDVGVIRAGDVVANSPVVPGAFIERDKLPHPVELTRAGDVLVLTDGRVRAGVDRRGGHVVAGPIQVVRPRSDVVSPEVLAALITYFGSRQAVGLTVPRINLKSLEIPLLDVDSTRSLDAALRMLGEHQHWTTVARGALDDLSDALVAGVTSGSLVLGDDTRGG
jgi:SAM-dependent methyltransferase